MLVGCAPQNSAARTAGPDQASLVQAPKRIGAAIRGDPHTLYQALNPNNNIPGIDALQELVPAGLSVIDDTGAMRPQLAEAIPSTQNGLWQVSPDGRMTTTWRIKPNAAWQDGVP